MLENPPRPSPDDLAVVVTDIGDRANERTASTLDFGLADDVPADRERKRRRAQLAVVDELYGPLNIASLTVTRSALDALGATIDGQPLNGQNTFLRIPNRFFVNSLQFSADAIEAQIRSIVDPEDYRLTTLLFELACQRPLAAPPLLIQTADKPAPASLQGKLDKILSYAQKLNIPQALQHTTLAWANKAKSTTMSHTGLGLQAFGVYSGLRGLQDAIKNKDDYNVVFNSISLSAEMTSIAVEDAVVRQATRMFTAAQGAAKDFAQTQLALRLRRGAGLIASALTLPIDIVSAVDAFKAAAKSTGRQATDHYVSAALSITSAVMTVGIGVAALAGFSAAGPVGLVAGLALAVGSQVWGAVRQVEEIDEYIELTAYERLRTGWLAFWLLEPDQEIQNRYIIAKATTEHTKQLQAEAALLLKGPLKDTTEAIVNGAFHVELEEVTFNSTSWLTGEKYLEHHQRPKIVDGDDTVDARNGVNIDTPGATIGASAMHKNVHWNIGDGNDTILGVEKKQNTFRYGNGIKHLSGGEKDDVFMFEGTNALPNKLEDGVGPSSLDGGQGSDTLILAGRPEGHQLSKRGYRVDLAGDQVFIIKADNTEHLQTVLKSIENIEIHEGGTNIIKGTDAANIIRSRGHDSIEAGGGDDSIYLLGANNLEADGGPGNDSYVIAHKPGCITLKEDGLDSSIVLLNWRADLIEHWQVTGQDLTIASVFDSNDMDARHVVIRDVYRTVGNRRHLNNKKLIFLTKEGYQLAPDLPDVLEGNASYKASIVVTKQGTPRNPSILLDKGTSIVPRDKDSDYFFSRFVGETTVDIKQPSPYATTLHVDYSSAELTQIEAHYTIHLTKDGDLDTLRYGKCDLTLHFGNSRVHIANLASSDERYTARVADRRLYSKLRLQHVFILVMQDGKSYRLAPASPAPAVFLDRKITKAAPLAWTSDLPLPLPPTKHTYAFRLPRDKEPFVMGTQATCAQLTPPPVLTGVEVLIGEGSTYLVHLKPHMTLRLCTPGALATATPRLPVASTWELDATGLGHVTIKLHPQLLQIGSVLVHLPEYGAQDLIDQINIITANGVVHAVDILFESVDADAIDARYFRPPKTPSETLPVELSTLAATEIKVRNIAVRDGSAGTVTYDLEKRTWCLRTDRLRLLKASELKKVNLCEHHIVRFQNFIQRNLDETAVFSIDVLKTLRSVFVELSERVTPTEADDLEVATILLGAFSRTHLPTERYLGQDIDPLQLAIQLTLKFLKHSH